MSDASVLRLAHTRPALFAVLETLLTENGTHEPWDPTGPWTG